MLLGQTCSTLIMLLVMSGIVVNASPPILVEDFEFATSDAAAAAGVIDITDFANSPSFYIFGKDENASPNEPGGLFSIGTDVVFCLQACIAGSFAGFRRQLEPPIATQTCGGQFYIPLQFSYGDPLVPGPSAPDFAISELKVICDLYGNGSFADGLLATHMWVRLVDCEGEKFEYVNYAEPSLWSELWTFDVLMGANLIRISPDSLVEVPHGDRLLTEIAAIEVLIQDEDFPPTTVGKWYIDYLRVQEPSPPAAGDLNGDGEVDLSDLPWFISCMDGPATQATEGCAAADFTKNGTVDLVDAQLFLPLLIKN